MTVDESNLENLNKEYNFLEKNIINNLRNININKNDGYFVIYLDSKKTLSLLILMDEKREKLTALDFINLIDKKIKSNTENLLKDINLNEANKIDNNKINFDLMSSLIDYEYLKRKELIFSSINIRLIENFKNHVKDNQKLRNLENINDEEITKLLEISSIIIGKNITEKEIKPLLEDFILTEDYKKALFNLPPSYNDYKTTYENIINPKKRVDLNTDVKKDIILSKQMILDMERSEDKLKKLFQEQIKNIHSDKSDLFISLKNNDVIKIKEKFNKEPIDLIIDEIIKDKSQYKKLEKAYDDKKLFLNTVMDFKIQNNLINGILNYKDENDYLFIYMKDKFEKAGFDKSKLESNKESLINLFAISGLLNGGYLSTKDNFVENVLLTKEFKALLNDLPSKFDIYKESLNKILNTEPLDNKKRNKLKM